MWVWIVLFLVVALLAYVRFAPVDQASFHREVSRHEDQDNEGSCVRVMPAREGDFARLDRAMMALERTQVLAGSVAEGRISYVTRSKVIGFPDITTIEETDGQIRMFARLRFGKSDLGVNRARLERVLGSLKS